MKGSATIRDSRFLYMKQEKDGTSSVCLIFCEEPATKKAIAY